MIVVPVVSKPRIPKKYIKSKCTHSELISVEYKVNTFVKFPEIKNRYYESKILNNQLVYIEKEKILSEHKYGFQIKVELSADEYNENSLLGNNKLNLYVIDKVKNTVAYKRCIQECIKKEDVDREFNLESFIADFPEFHKREYESEEYIPVY